MSETLDQIHTLEELEAFFAQHGGQDPWMDEAINLIQEKAATGKIGDGKIFVIPLEEAIRIRTGEKGKEAI